MKFTESTFTLFSFILIVLGLSNSVSYFWQFGIINPIYLLYLMFGIVACYFTFKRKTVGLWLFIIFFLIQVVRVFSPEFNYNFTTGLSMFFSYYEGDRYTPPAERRGFAINFLSVGMIIYAAVLLGFRRRDKSGENQP
ncbi:hypothetical protein ACQKPX_07230 [Photobacterium sp. DNB23_23_1]